MTTDASPIRSRAWSFFNKLLIVFQVITGSILIIMIIQNNFAEISTQMFPQGAPLMGSKIADLLMHKWFAVVIALVILGAIAKEFFIDSVRKRLLINIAIFVALELLAGMLVKLMFSIVFG